MILSRVDVRPSKTKWDLSEDKEMIDWKRKLSSRKFWALIAALVTSWMVLFGVDAGVQMKVIAILGNTGAVVAYILSEGYVDGVTRKE